MTTLSAPAVTLLMLVCASTFNVIAAASEERLVVRVEIQGHPLGGAHVLLHDKKGDVALSSTTDDEGYADLGPVGHQKEVTLTVSHIEGDPYGNQPLLQYIDSWVDLPVTGEIAHLEVHGTPTQSAAVARIGVLLTPTPDSAWIAPLGRWERFAWWFDVTPNHLQTDGTLTLLAFGEQGQYGFLIDQALTDQEVYEIGMTLQTRDVPWRSFATTDSLYASSKRKGIWFGTGASAFYPGVQSGTLPVATDFRGEKLKVTARGRSRGASWSSERITEDLPAEIVVPEPAPRLRAKCRTAGNTFVINHAGSIDFVEMIFSGESSDGSGVLIVSWSLVMAKKQQRAIELDIPYGGRFAEVAARAVDVRGVRGYRAYMLKRLYDSEWFDGRDLASDAVMAACPIQAGGMANTIMQMSDSSH